MLTERSVRRFWTKVDKSAGPTGCWTWSGNLRSDGYGEFHAQAAPGVSRRAHVLSFTLANGPVPEGLTVDHTCHNADQTCAGGPSCMHRRCVNPSHLDATDRGENVMRGVTLAAANAAKTHCYMGHPFTEENTRVNAQGWRHCVACRRATANERYRRRQLEVV